MTHHVNLDTLVLDSGAHISRDDGVCLLEAVAYFAGEGHTDAPACVSIVLRTFGTRLNDVLPDGKRQALKPLIPQLVGTAGDGLDEARSYMALDWLIRTYTPVWLDLAGLTAEATALRDLRRIVDLVAAQEAARSSVPAGRRHAPPGRPPGTPLGPLPVPPPRSPLGTPPRPPRQPPEPPLGPPPGTPPGAALGTHSNPPSTSSSSPPSTCTRR